MNVAERNFKAPENLPDSVTAIVPGSLYAIGGFLPADRPLSWMSRKARGFLPMHCYALRSGEDFFLVDTGLVIHKEAIQAGIAALVAGAKSRRVILTRREPDTMHNMIWLVREFGFQSIQCAAPADPFDMIEKMDEALTNAQVKAMLGVSHSFTFPGVTMKVGDLELSSIRPAIRVLLTDWLYESRTRTLFTSDTWGFLTKAKAEGPVTVTPSPQDISVENIKDHLNAKFEWLRGIDTAPVAEAVKTTMQEREIERICPYYGCVIEGRDAVRLLVANTLKALEELAKETPREPLRDFSWPESRNPLSF